jgi:hypothetical protein
VSLFATERVPRNPFVVDGVVVSRFCQQDFVCEAA